MKFFLLMAVILNAAEGSFSQSIKLRGLADTVGFAHEKWQMDSIANRIEREYGTYLDFAWKRNNISSKDEWKLAVCPHDDYAYASYMYPLVLRNVKAKTIILFGVAHKAKQFNLQDKIIFDSFTHWNGCYGKIKCSPLREKIISQLPKSIYEMNDSMQAIEHSVEGILPFIQYNNKNIEIISILVPYNSFEKMDSMAKPLASAIASVMKEKKLKWGSDISIVISNDAIHYGDEDWGGKDLAPFGTGTEGQKGAMGKESEIIQQCFSDTLTREKAQLFSEYTVLKEDYKQYLWTWCGRYSVPMGMLTAFYLGKEFNTSLYPVVLDYSSSISNPADGGKHLKVDDLKMGTTAPANLRHWVGYASIGFR